MSNSILNLCRNAVSMQDRVLICTLLQDFTRDSRVSLRTSCAGIVRAAEIVNAFPGEDGLKEFRAWTLAPDYELIADATASPAEKRQRRRESGGSEGLPDIGGGSFVPFVPIALHGFGPTFRCCVTGQVCPVSCQSG